MRALGSGGHDDVTAHMIPDDYRHIIMRSRPTTDTRIALLEVGAAIWLLFTFSLCGFRFINHVYLGVPSLPPPLLSSAVCALLNEFHLKAFHWQAI